MLTTHEKAVIKTFINAAAALHGDKDKIRAWMHYEEAKAAYDALPTDDRATEQDTSALRDDARDALIEKLHTAARIMMNYCAGYYAAKEDSTMNEAPRKPLSDKARGNLAQQLLNAAEREGVDTYTKTMLWQAATALDDFPLLSLSGRREEIARVINPKAWTEVECAPEDHAIWAKSRQMDRDKALAKADAILALPAPECRAGERDSGAAQFIENVSLDIAELPDRTSPEDHPAMMLVTHEELESIIRAHLPILLASASPPRSAEVEVQNVADKLADALRHLNAAITDAGGFRTPKMRIANDLGSKALDAYLALPTAPLVAEPEE